MSIPEFRVDHNQRAKIMDKFSFSDCEIKIPVIVKSYFYDTSVKVDTVGRIDGLQSSLLLKEFGLFLVWSSQ